MAHYLLYTIPFILLQMGGHSAIAPIVTFIGYVIARQTNANPKLGKVLVGVHVLACFASALVSGNLAFIIPVAFLPTFLYNTNEDISEDTLKKFSLITVIGSLLFIGKNVIEGNSLFNQAGALAVAISGLLQVMIGQVEKEASSSEELLTLQQENKDLTKQIRNLNSKLAEQTQEDKTAGYMSVILGLEFTGFSEEENIDMTLNTIKKALKPIFCGYYAVDENMRSFILTQSIGNCTAFGKREEFGMGFIGETQSTQRLSTLSNLQASTDDVFQRQQLNGVNFALAFPVVVKEKVVGAFALGMGTMTEKEEQMIASLCSIIANKINIEFTKILDHKQVTEKSITDKLTGLYNRLYFEELFPAEFERAREENRSIAYMLIDLDFFKQMNDTHGHEFGDKVLKLAAKTFKENIRKSDYAFRTGGDEFSIVLMGATPEAARHVATKIAKEYEKIVEKEHLYALKDGREVRSSFSIGIAVYPITPVREASQLVKKADDAVYFVKEHGKNNIAVAGGK